MKILTTLACAGAFTMMVAKAQDYESALAPKSSPARISYNDEAAEEWRLHQIERRIEALENAARVERARRATAEYEALIESAKMH